MPTPQENLAARLLETALDRGWGDRVALREGERAWSYAKLAEQVARVATAMRTLRVAPGDRVAVFMRDSLDTAAAILGVMHAGAVAVPLSELSRPLDVRECLRDSGAVVAIVHSPLAAALAEVRSEVPALREILCVGARGPGEHDFHSLVRASAPAAAPASVSPGDPAMLLYSAAGRERSLRGVPHAHATPMSAFGSFAHGVVGLDEHDRVFSVVRLSTSYGLGTGLFFPLRAGAETMLLPEQPHSDAVFEVIESFAPTVLFATPSVYGQLARDAEVQKVERPLASLRVCVSGAEGMPPKLIPRIRQMLGAEVVVGYGLTEAFQFVLAGPATEARPGFCGTPVPGFEARIIDEAGAPVGPDVIGTLQIRGPTVLTAYWGAAADEDAEQFADGWFTTLDRFLMDEEGGYYHCGRVDDLFKVSGKWVSPTEVESALLAHEAVWECAVIGADDEDGLIKPLAFIVPNIGHDPGEALEQTLRDYVKAELSPYKYPRWIQFVEQLPKGPTGKILRYKLRAPETVRRAETASDA
jgi:benzoate-CoA ligase family protein